jgi:hypothetical protein
MIYGNCELFLTQDGHIPFPGTLPTEAEGIIDVKVCKVGFADCCSRKYDVKVKNCGSFYAYCLGALDSCSERYCFGKNIIYSAKGLDKANMMDIVILTK